MYISPQYTDDDWRKLSFSTEDEWQKAIDIFKDRVHGRFLEPISRIEEYIYAGFAVLALDCLLIETLQQFRKGIRSTSPGEGETFFALFLTETSFGSYFTKKMAEKFYQQIRCGILHQAEVKENSKVLIRKDTPLIKYTGDRKGLVINRKLFHQQLVREFEDYVARLREPSNQELREGFRKKMNYICRVSGEID